MKTRHVSPDWQGHSPIGLSPDFLLNRRCRSTGRALVDLILSRLATIAIGTGWGQLGSWIASIDLCTVVSVYSEMTEPHGIEIRVVHYAMISKTVLQQSVLG